MIKIKYSWIKGFSLMLLALPAMLFFLTWLKLYISIPAVIVLALGLYFSIKDTKDKESFEIPLYAIIVIIVLIAIWAILSGQGGFFTQKADHLYRNHIFKDMINYKWPLLYNNANDEGLVYYVGYWIVPALAGKFSLFLSTNTNLSWIVANVALVIWTVLLLLSVMLLLVYNLKAESTKKIFLILFILVFFSGMDFLGIKIREILINNTFAHWEHIEWWSGDFQYSSNSTQLCWVFNQAVPAWIATALFIGEKNLKSYALIGLLLLPTSPLPLIGLTIIMLVCGIQKMFISIKNKEFKEYTKEIFSVPNLAGLIALLPIYALYYQKNAISSTGGTGLRTSMVAFNDGINSMIIYVAFILVEFLILSLLLIKYNKNAMYFCAVIELIIFPFVYFGSASDFVMRASIPALFIIMFALQRYLIQLNKNKKTDGILEKTKTDFLKIAIIACFIFGMATPIAEYSYSINLMIRTQGKIRVIYEGSSLSDLPLDGKMNFVCTDAHNTLFYKYLAR